MDPKTRSRESVIAEAKLTPSQTTYRAVQDVAPEYVWYYNNAHSWVNATSFNARLGFSHSLDRYAISSEKPTWIPASVLTSQ